MVAAFKEYIFDFEDMKLLSIVCENCHTETIIDLSRPESKIPKRCEPCKSDLKPNFHQALHEFHRAYYVLADKSATGPASARIRVQRELTASEF